MEWIKECSKKPVCLYKEYDGEMLSDTVLVSDTNAIDVGHYNQDQDRWTTYNEYGYMGEVTHWMELPKKPS